MTTKQGEKSHIKGGTSACSRDFLSRVRERTAKLHNDLEEANPFLVAEPRLPEFWQMLRCLQPVFACVESELASLPAERQLEFGIPSRMRSEALRSAIVTQFGKRDESCDNVNMQIRQMRNCVSSASFAAGCLYVLEGSRLGGHQILKAASSAGLDEPNARQFLHGYGSATVVNWKRLLAQCETSISTTEEKIQGCEVAELVFVQFLAQF